MEEEQMDEKHDHQHRSKRANYGGSRGEIREHGKVNAQRGNQSSHGPTNCQASSHSVSEEHGPNGRHYQIAEDQQHAAIATEEVTTKPKEA